MIAKAKAVAHGIRAMLYVSGESRNKKHPKGLPVSVTTSCRRAWMQQAFLRK